MCERSDRFLTLDNMNPYVRRMEFNVETPVAKRAKELRQELSRGNKKTFTEVMNAHVGDSHALGQKPLTYIRQIVALVLMPELLNDARFPDDVTNKAKALLDGCRNHSIGSYSDSPGLEVVRKQIAKHIEERDGVPSSWRNIVCTNGATDAVKMVLSLLAHTESVKTGILIPVPQYPFYSACIAELDLHCVKYYLNEEKNWTVEIDNLYQAVEKAKTYCKPKAIIVINPGNPTGQVLSRENIENVIKFAHKENLLILADEVQQDCIHSPDKEFHSFKKVLTQMGAPYSSTQLVSFMSGSKGLTGESGLRAGGSEFTNVDPEVVAMLVKIIASATCPTVLGQTVMYCVTNRPKITEPSFNLYNEEKSTILNSLHLNAQIVRETLNSLPGYSCQLIESIYAFPRVEMPPKAVEVAKDKYQDASELYAMELLEATGVCVAPGCYFGQNVNPYHFRMTILFSQVELRGMLLRIKEFHVDFLKKYS